MAEKAKVQFRQSIVVRFSGDSGDGMQLAGNIFSNVSAGLGDRISTFPDYPAEVRAPQGSLGGVSGFQVHIGHGVHTPGDECDVLVAMNPAALKQNAQFLRKGGAAIVDIDTFTQAGLDKALYTTSDPYEELNLNAQVIEAPITTMVKEALKDTGMDLKAQLKCRNMFALGLVCWLFNRPMEAPLKFLKAKFADKPEVYAANELVIKGGYNYGHNIHATVSTYRIQSDDVRPGTYTDVSGNKATAWGLIKASEMSGRPLFLGSYPITPATDILHELAKRRDLGVKAIQMEDEIGGICSAIGAAFAGHLAVTTTSGPGLALKSEALGLAVMAELPLVLVDVQRGGPSTGLPTKTEQTDLQQALYGRSGESPLVVLAAASPTDCFKMAFQAARIAIEHMTPVILLTDAFIANGSSAWRIPEEGEYPVIKPNYVPEALKPTWTPFMRNALGIRYWAIPGTPGLEHVVGGLEKDYNMGVLSNDPINHAHMVETRRMKIANVANDIPELKLKGDPTADTIILGWGSTYGHILDAVNRLNNEGFKIAMTHIRYINPLPKNAAELLSRFKTVIVAELNTGQLASYLQSKIANLNICHINKVQGQPFLVQEIDDGVKNIMME
ncbi:MAG: 2-oxoacid:acceptor oxidoreductase subunit alpha, partial [Muribaculaceae bacterium]|nr:2-oxoacid:acceptor oxidoreductase subunit alpha [Muribaculaceae bacterium]